MNGTCQATEVEGNVRLARLHVPRAPDHPGQQRGPLPCLQEESPEDQAPDVVAQHDGGAEGRTANWRIGIQFLDLDSGNPGGVYEIRQHVYRVTSDYLRSSRGHVVVVNWSEMCRSRWRMFPSMKVVRRWHLLARAVGVRLDPHAGKTGHAAGLQYGTGTDAPSEQMGPRTDHHGNWDGGAGCRYHSRREPRTRLPQPGSAGS